MSARLPDVVTVVLDAAELEAPSTVGTLRRITAPGGSTSAFSYDEAWVDWPGAFTIDPSHGLYPGDQFPRPGQNLSPVFTDAAPDRWGRTLMERREAADARREGRARRSLGEWEVLLGTNDATRMGALRFRGPDGRFLSDASPSVPPLERLPALQSAASEIERPTGRDRAAEAEQLALLLAPGSSLGGARPKATIEDRGDLWIAKFPSRNDNRDMAGCEWVLNELAAAAGIRVPEHRVVRLGAAHHTFLARRFDREDGSRRLYASAMTMLGRRDREQASYLDIALAVADHAPTGRIEAELEQLFRRVVFNVSTAHRDDHLRNHGFLRVDGGWELAPAFDLNPMPEMAVHELAIDDASHEPDLDLVVETAPFYRLDPPNAARIVDEVTRAVRGWQPIASRVPLSEVELGALEDSLG